MKKQKQLLLTTNNEAAEEPDEVYKELDSESEISEEENCIQKKNENCLYK